MIMMRKGKGMCIVGCETTFMALIIVTILELLIIFDSSSAFVYQNLPRQSKSPSSFSSHKFVPTTDTVKVLSTTTTTTTLWSKVINENDNDNETGNVRFDTLGQQNRQWLIERFGCTERQLSKRLENHPSRYNATLTSELNYRALWLQKRLDLNGTQLNKIIQQHPKCLSRRVDTHVEPMLDCIERSLNLNKESLKNLVIRQPKVLTSKQENIELRLQYLKCRLKFDEAKLQKVVSKLPTFLTYSIEGIKAKLDWFQQIGLSDAQVAKMIHRNPGLLTLSIQDNMEPTLKWIKQRLSLTSTEASNLIARQPTLLGLNITTNTEPKIDFYFDTIETDGDVVAFILKNPTALLCSLDKRLKPRLTEAKKAYVVVDISCLFHMVKDTPEQWPAFLVRKSQNRDKNH